MKVAVIIPARNEERSIGLVLAAIPAALVSEVIVVDNGSTDRTAELAAAGGARVIREERQGYGSACLAGIAALAPDVECVVFLDADFSDHPEEMPILIEPIARGEADLVIGSRLRGRRERGALLPQAYFGNRLACALLWLFWGHRFTDLGPFRAIAAGALHRLGMRDPDFGWTAEMQARALRAKLRVAERPVSYRRRVGVSKITGTVSGTIRAGWKIISTIVRIRFGAGR